VSTGPHQRAVSFTLERPDRAALEGQWRALEARADITLYLSWDWIGPWVDEAGLPDWVLVGRADGEIVCLGLLRRRDESRHRFVKSRTLYLHATGREDQDVIVIEYNGLLTDRRHGPLEAEAIAFLRSRQKEIGGFDEISLDGVTGEMFEAIRAGGGRTHVHALKSTAFVDLKALRDGRGEYLETLSANTRQQIRRSIRIYEARGPLVLEPAQNMEEALAWFDALGVLHEAGWRARGESGGAWRYPFLVAFHRRVISRSFPHGVEVVRIRCGEQIVGFVHCLVRGGWIGSYLSGFAYEADNKVKPGLVSFYLYIQHRLKIGGDVVDFLAGDHRYKISLGTPGPKMYWFRVQEPRLQFVVERALRRVKKWVERRRGSSRG
jgi:hypothetical protein